MKKAKGKLTRYRIRKLDNFASKLCKNIGLAVDVIGNTKFLCDKEFEDFPTFKLAKS